MGWGALIRDLRARSAQQKERTGVIDAMSLTAADALERRSPSLSDVGESDQPAECDHGSYAADGNTRVCLVCGDVADYLAEVRRDLIATLDSSDPEGGSFPGQGEGLETFWGAQADAILSRFSLVPRYSVSEPSGRNEYGPAASCHLCVGAGGYEGFDGEWVECSCQRSGKVD